MINIEDNWDKIPYLLQTYKYNQFKHLIRFNYFWFENIELKNFSEPNLDTQWYLMPHLSNGFLGTTAKNTSLYFNGTKLPFIYLY